MLKIRPIQASDQTAWLVLWQGYVEFYKATVSAEQTELTWKRLIDESDELNGLVAEQGGQLLGFTHSFIHSSTWVPHGYAYLEDLFVAPQHRGQGAARALIEAVAAWGEAQGASKLYWLTQESNATARLLYDKVAAKSENVQYQRVLSLI